MQTIKQLQISDKEEFSAELQFYIPWDRKNQNTHVARFAYYRAKARDFESGHELEDWLLAEAEVNEYFNHLSGTG